MALGPSPAAAAVATMRRRAASPARRIHLLLLLLCGCILALLLTVNADPVAPAAAARSLLQTPDTGALLVPSVQLVVDSQPCLASTVTLRATATGVDSRDGDVEYTWTMPAGLESYAAASSTASFIELPSEALVPGSSYSFSVSVRNGQGVSSASSSVTYLRPQFPHALHLAAANPDSLDQLVLPTRTDQVFLSAGSSFEACFGAPPSSLHQRFVWSVDPDIPEMTADKDSWGVETSTLSVDPSVLQLAREYSFTLRSWFEEDPSTEDTLVFRLRAGYPLKAVIRGPSANEDVSNTTPFVLDGSESTGAGGPTDFSGMQYKWTCHPWGTQMQCMDSVGAPVVTPRSSVLGPVTMPTGKFTFTLTVSPSSSSDGGAAGSSTARIDIDVKDSNSNNNKIFLTIEGPATVNPAQVLQLETSISSASSGQEINPDRLRYTWSQKISSDSDSSATPAAAATTTGAAASAAPQPLDLSLVVLTHPSLTLNGELNFEFFKQGQSYEFECLVEQMNDEGTDVVSSGTATKRVLINSAPKDGSVTIVAASAGTGASVALQTMHTLKAEGWTDQEGDAPLSYQFFYIREEVAPAVPAQGANNDTTPATGAAVIPGPGGVTGLGKRVYMNFPSEARVLSDVLLPVGAPLTVGVSVTDARGASSSRTTTLSVSAPATSSLSTMPTAFEEALSTAINTSNSTGVLYLTSLYADFLSHAASTGSSSSDDADFLSLRDTLQGHVSDHMDAQPALLVIGAIDSLLSVPAGRDAAFFQSVLDLVGRVVNVGEQGFTQDGSAQTEEFRSMYASVLEYVLSHLPANSPAAANSTATPSKRRLMQIGSAAPAGSTAELIQHVFSSASSLLSAQSFALIPSSQLVFSSASGEMRMGLVRSDGIRSNSELVVPQLAGGNIVLRAIKSKSTGAAASTAAGKATDFKILLSNINPVLDLSLASVPSQFYSGVSGGSDNSAPAAASQVEQGGPLFSALIAVTSSDAKALEDHSAFDVGEKVVLSISYAPALCTMLPPSQIHMCAPLCLVWDASAGAWTERGVTTILSKASVAASEAHCELDAPAVLGVQQRISLRPEAELLSSSASSTEAGGAFSSKGLRPGGAGFFILIFLAIAILALAGGVFFLLARRAAARKTKFSLAASQEEFDEVTLPHGAPGGIAGRRKGILEAKKILVPNPKDERDMEVVESREVDGATPDLPLRSPPTTMLSSSPPIGSPSGAAYDAVQGSPTGLMELQPQFQDMEYPSSHDLAPAGAALGTITPAGEGVGSSMHTPLGRVFLYGSSSNAASARASRATSRAASKAVSRAGSLPASNAGSRRVSPERSGLLQVTVPAAMVHVPGGGGGSRAAGGPERRKSFNIGEISNQADAVLAARQKKAAASAAAASSSSADADADAADDRLLARRGSTGFANLEDQGDNTFYSMEPAPLSPDAASSLTAAALNQSSFGGAAPAGIHFTPATRMQVTRVVDAQPLSPVGEQGRSPEPSPV